MVHRCDWLALELAEVECPSGRRLTHHVVRVPQPAVGVVVHDPERGVLMLRRHRFIVDTFGWEIPAGRVEPGESPAAAAAREVLEETGFQVGPIQLLTAFAPSIGLSDQRFVVAAAAGASRLGPPSDPDEAVAVAWVPIPTIWASIRAGTIAGGLSLAALLFALTVGPLGGEPLGGEPLGGEPLGGEPLGGEPLGGLAAVDR